MTKDEALKLGIEALENIDRWLPTIGQKGLRDYEADALAAMKEALAQPAQKPRLDQGPDYERGFVDGMLYQTQTSVNKAVNAIAQPAQEPVAWISKHGVVYPLDAKYEVHPINELQPLYTAPPKRPWVGLTDENKTALAKKYWQNKRD